MSYPNFHEHLCRVGLTMLCSLMAIAPVTADEPRHLSWPQLVPPGWVLENPFSKLTDEQFADLIDDDELVERMMREFELAQASAPVVAALDGVEARLDGYIVPLDFEGTEISEFLLVPYFGACIHVPPPPANQVVHVTTERPYAVEALFEAVTVTGRLSTKGYLNEVGDAGYSLAAASIEPYAE